jgi:hypothetical protein
MRGAGTAPGVPCGAGPQGVLPGSLILIHTNNSPNPVSMRVSDGWAMPSEPWRQGVESGLMGWGVNPYESFSRDGWAWSAGYVEGRAYARST